MKPTMTTEEPRFVSLAVGLICLALGIVGLLLFCNMAMINRLRIEADLQDYARVVRRSAISFGEKERILDVIELIEDQLASGDQFGWRQWSRHNHIVREILEKGIDGDEGRLIERELQRVKRKIEENKQ
jgi:hypothetical protein